MVEPKIESERQHGCYGKNGMHQHLKDETASAIARINDDLVIVYI
jgi:hypothetical protein